MSSQAIKDFLVKQLFIEKNVVTYRSLSRQFGIHVNAAKEELAKYHENAPSDSQTSFATYLLTGEIDNPQRRIRASRGQGSSKNGLKADMSMDVDDDEDFGMDMFVPTQTDSGDEEEDAGDDDDDEEEDEDYEDATTISVTIVNEDELEDAKEKYIKLSSVHVYSLSPSPIHDATYLCAPTADIRKIDNAKGPEHAKAVGRVVAPNIHVKPIKTKALPAAASSSKATPAKIEDVKPSTTKPEGPSASAAAATKVEGDKKAPVPKKTGKLDFFGAKAKKPEEKSTVKKEEPVKEEKKPAKMFFGAAKPKEAKATKPVAVKKEEEEEDLSQVSARGTKRKSIAPAAGSDSEGEATANKSRKTAATALASKPASRISSRAPSVAVSKPPSSVASTSRASSRRSSASSALAIDFSDEDDEEPVRKVKEKELANVKVKKRRVMSDEEEEEEEEENKVLKKRNTRREEKMKEVLQQEAKEAMDFMDMDDDLVERHVRKEVRKGNRPNPLPMDQEEEEDEEEVAPKKAGKAGVLDISMDVDTDGATMESEDELIPKPAHKRRREKKVVPLGSNGLKKRKVVKTRTFKGSDGYMQTEDYSDWESVDGDAEEAEPVKKATKAKPRPAAKKALSSKDTSEEEEKSPSVAPPKPKKESKPVKAPAAKKPAAPKAKPVATKGKAGQAGIRSFFNVAQK
ncbi:DNA polymerase subunit Cdc27-domain-containing protein [Ephemerocybe angulata]|uniref:DNA polymerase delta subunit 3 n=1 Tax=Ephemerocybe angulata TaxID=980116 RepID=A0A8H6ICA3_9AGAR|nr:DNA polymerase subunit Cdc27-domain-containing protein [Tulosesus angulatus]